MDYKKPLFLGLKIVLLLVIIAGVVAMLKAIQLINKGSPGGGSGTHTVVVRDNRFEPPVLSVKFGDTVVWKNEGLRSHTVTFRSLSKTLAPQESWSWVVNQDLFSTGENVYWDDFYRNQGMQAKIVVK